MSQALSRQQTELVAGDRQLLFHRQRCKPNIDAVEKADDLHQEKKGENPDPHFPNRSSLNGLRTGVYFAAHHQPSVSLSSTLRGTMRPVRANHLFSTPLRSDC